MDKPISSLNLLLSATSKNSVEKCLNLTFASRNEPSENCVVALNSLLDIGSMEQAKSLHDSLLTCIQVALASNSLEDLAELFKTNGADVNPKLKSLIGQTISANLEVWKESASIGRISLPKLIDFDWAIHLKKASNEISTMSVPAIIVSLDVEEIPTISTELAPIKTINFEMSREVLDTVLDGFGKIRDQLSHMG
eukprot:gene5949-8200_t